MRAVDELQQPVGYDERWVWLALLAIMVAVVYYASVLWWTRPRRARPAPRRSSRKDHLTRLDDIEAAFADGLISAREGHQRISATVRSYVAETSGVPAPAMTLADLERDGPAELADVVAVLYRPEFGTDEVLAQQAFGDAIGQARGMVSTWT